MGRAKSSFRAVAIVVSVAMLEVSGAAASETTTGIMVEGVSNYSACSQGNIHGATDAANFLSGMTVSGSGWTEVIPKYNSAVWDTDFYDPDFSKSSNDNDTLRSDQLGTAIAYFSLHGSCNDAYSNQQYLCTTSLDCPPAKLGTNTYCPGNPPSNNQSACITDTERVIVTCGSQASHANTDFYASDYAIGDVKWGEDLTSGDWANAGTNGDNNVVFLVNSCGGRIPEWEALGDVFAGMQLLNILVPTSNVHNPNVLNDQTLFSDEVDLTTRGTDVATKAIMNPAGSISGAWLAILDEQPNPSNSGGCPDLNPAPYKYGGGSGFSGCGAHYSVAFDNTQSNALYDREMTWYQAQSNYSIGRAAYSFTYHCNYDCNTYPIKK
jgi:hypothetical protein